MYFIKRPRVIIYNIVLVLCFVASVTFSSIAQSYTVSGNVISSENNAQIEFANGQAIKCSRLFFIQGNVCRL